MNEPPFDLNFMPVECSQLHSAPVAIETCPLCQAAPFRPFLRGLVQRWPRKWWIGPRRDYCALICWECKEIVGYESP